MRLKVFDIINGPARNSSIDVFRCFAIVGVVLFHFNYTLPFGDIGVDLFFVISGVLVGGLLTKEFLNEKPVQFFRFILQRGFKIWPSYYFFLIAGTLLAWLLYKESHPDQIFSGWKDASRYIFFYQNYTGKPFHSDFDHAWSLCVEEHFYILLPLVFIVLSLFQKHELRVKLLFISVILIIGAGILFKPLSYLITNSKDTMMGTHNRIDSLAWGVLLNLLAIKKQEYLKMPAIRIGALLAGILILSVSVWFHYSEKAFLFNKLAYHSIMPFGFFLLLLSCYFADFSRFKFLRFISYYSYNWYLWHPLCVIVVLEKFGSGIMGLIIYLLVSFSLAFITTVFVEEPVLARRSSILEKIFGKKENKESVSAETA